MSDDPPGGMGDRTGVSRTAFWLYVDAPRWVVVVGVLGVVVSSVVVAGTLAQPLSGDPVETLFQALVGATITGVTLVVTLNQLVLSQELGAVGDQRERLEAATSFRRDVETMIDGVAPTDPSAFLSALMSAAVDRAETARAAGATGDAGTAVARVTDRTVTSARSVEDRLAGAEFGDFSVTRAALDFDYSQRIGESRRVRAEHDLPEAADDALEELIEVLELYGVAREHVKTLYFQRALIGLSRSVVAAAVPGLTVGVLMILSFRPEPGVTTPVVVGVAVGVTLSPFGVLVAYVLRIATVAGRTLSIGPFTLRQTGTDRGE